MAEVLGNMEAAGSFTGEIGPGCFTGGIGVKETADGFIFDFGVSKAGLGNKDAADSFTGEIGVTKAGLGNKEAFSFAGEIVVTEARDMVTEASWIDYVILYEKEQPLLAPKQGREAKPTVAMITKEKVPDSFIEILVKRRPFKKHPPLTDEYSNFLSTYNPELRELWLIDRARRNCCVDLHVDVLRQYKEKGFAEVGVDFTGGVKNIFVLGHHP